MNRIERLATGIAGFDLITYGGFPKGRISLVSGTAGSGKTLLAVQFLAEGIRRYGQAGVFLTFEESPEDIRRNMIGLGWDIAAWEAEGKWIFVDASPRVSEETIIVGEYDLGALLSRIENAIRQVNATRLSADSIGAVFSRFGERITVRDEMLRIAGALKQMEVTAILTAERTAEYGSIARYGVEEFVADNVIIMRNVLEDEKRRRTIEILKLRGASHQKGEFPLAIVPEEGIVIIPLSAIELEQNSSSLRISSGNEELDRMCGGGFFRDSIIKHQEVSGLFTSTTPTLMGGTSVTEAHISTLTDSIILLRYVELSGEMRRGLTVLKMRGSQHEKDIREFSIDNHGMHIGKAFRHIGGILSGNPVKASPGEIEQIGQLFKDLDDH